MPFSRLLALVMVLGVAGVLLTPTAPAAPTPKRDTPVDQAIDKALAFLANTQDKTDGSWRSGSTRSPAVTGLAIMAFLSAGHLPGEGPYGETVERGIRWVLKSQQTNGLFAGDGGQEMYNHGICTLMLAEAAGMTTGALSKEIRTKLTRAVEIILKAQRSRGSEKGGWRYQVAHVLGSDLSVTGWQILALRAARNVGCDVPATAINDAVEYIQRCQDPVTGGFRYTPDDGVTVPCTGTGILALELCGKDMHKSAAVVKAGGYLLKNPPRWGAFFFWYMVYYCSQATFQLGDNYWNFYRPQLHDVLLRNQQANGSWYGGGSDSGYGPNYCTSMGVLALTVEYRFLPIYQRVEEPAEKSDEK
jgi:hypothetical protein